MDSTTKMEVERILRQGYYRKSQTLGEGGWGKIPDWNTYEFDGHSEDGNDVHETIEAKDDETALKAFSSLYHLEMFIDWELYEKIVEYRLVESKQTIEEK